MKKISRVARALSTEILQPPPLLTVDEWAEQFRYLSSESASAAGKWHNYRAPYLVGIMRAFNDPNIETIVFKKSAQVGGTEVLSNILGYVITQDPAPILMVQPTGLICEAFIKDRFLPMCRDTRQLANLVQLEIDKTRLVQDTLLHKTFKGGHFSLAGANSPASLAARPIKILLLDEVDRYPITFAAEGDVVSIAKKRTTAFYNRKIVMCSTPTIKDASRIDFEFLASDQRRFFVPCPHCSVMQVLKMGNMDSDFGLKWSDEKPLVVRYMCESCHQLIDHTDKQRMLLQGEWRATSTDGAPRTAGFHINELYSPFVSWDRLVENFLEAKKDPATLRTFINVSLGETWEDQSQHIPPETVSLRAENYEGVPDGVLVLTAGVDIQGDRVESEVCGYGHNQESWGIERNIIYGDPASAAIWQQLDSYLKKTFKSAHGDLPISCVCIDSGFATDSVYAFTRPRAARRIFAVKGTAGAGKQLVGKPMRIKDASRSLKVFPVGVDGAKDIIYSRLAIETAGDTQPYMHFPQHYHQDFFDQLTAEKAITKISKSGQAQRVYVKIRPRNEALDIRVYSLAALKLLNVDIDKLSVPFELSQPQKSVKQTNPIVKRSPFEQILKQMQQRPHKGGWVNRW